MRARSSSSSVSFNSEDSSSLQPAGHTPSTLIKGPWHEISVGISGRNGWEVFRDVETITLLVNEKISGTYCMLGQFKVDKKIYNKYLFMDLYGICLVLVWCVCSVAWAWRGWLCAPPAPTRLRLSPEPGTIHAGAGTFYTTAQHQKKQVYSTPGKESMGENKKLKVSLQESNLLLTLMLRIRNRNFNQYPDPDTNPEKIIPAPAAPDPKWHESRKNHSSSGSSGSEMNLK